jgi:hypothetical protein
MGESGKPDPALVVVGVLYSDPSVLEKAIEAMQPVLGRISNACDPIPFGWTEYYVKELGDDLKRIFLHSEKLSERDLLADLKLWTNRIENDHAREDGSRRINLDPGLLTEENFVLATTKNRGHRIYLRDGIFAEVTLLFHLGRFESLDSTFPDYRSDEVRAIFESIRTNYRKKLKSGKYQVLREVVS